MADRPAPNPSLLLPVCCRHHVARLWLFGSALGGEFTSTSDIDILVEFEPDAHVGLIALSRLQRELSTLFGRPVDLVPLRGLKPALRDEVLAKRELVYAA